MRSNPATCPTPETTGGGTNGSPQRKSPSTTAATAVSTPNSSTPATWWERYCNIHGLDAQAEEDDILNTYIRRQQKCAALGLNPSDVFPSHASSIQDNPIP